MKGVRRLFCFAGLVALAAVAFAAVPAQAKKRGKVHRPPVPAKGPSCSYAEEGVPGPAGNSLTIKLDKSVFSILAAINVREREIVVSAIDRAGCRGGTPTLDNVDQIHLVLPGEVVLFDIPADVLYGGATPEADGFSEIELDVAMRRDGVVGLTGNAAAEEFTAGPGPSGGLVVDVGPRGVTGDSDVDVFVPRGGVQLDGAAGDDLLSNGGETGALLPPRAVGLNGGAGNDTLIGSPGKDVVSGGEGADTTDTFAGADFVFFDEGMGDVIRTGEGNDQVVALGGGSVVDCGGGADVAVGSRTSTLTGCERANRRVKGFLGVLAFLDPRFGRKQRKLRRDRAKLPRG